MDKIIKSFPALVIKADSELGIVEAIVSVIGNIDLGDDVIHPGSFIKTITERLGKIRVLDNHRTSSTLDVIGKPLEIRELSKAELPPELIEKFPSATGGLYTKTQYLINTPEGKGIFDRIKEGAIDEYSIGFSIPRGKYDVSSVVVDGIKKQIRNIREIRLFEYSPVIFGMNDATTTLAAKSERKELSLLAKHRKVQQAFEDLYFEHSEDDYSMNYSGYMCTEVYNNYLMAKPCNIETTYGFYKVGYMSNEDCSDINFANTEDWQGGNLQFVLGAKDYSEIEEIKAGRMISSANMEKLQAAFEAIEAILNAAKPAESDDVDTEEYNNSHNTDDIKADTELQTQPLITLTDDERIANYKLQNLKLIEFLRNR